MSMKKILSHFTNLISYLIYNWAFDTRNYFSNLVCIYANFQIIKLKEYQYYKNKYSIFFIIFWVFFND